MVEKLGVESVDTKADANDDESGTEESAREVGLFAEEDGEDGGGGECGGVGDGDGEGERGVGEDSEECGGGGEVDEEGDGVLPDQEELHPVAERDRDSLVDGGVRVWLWRGF